MQGWSIMNLSFFCVLLSLISTINLTYNVQAAKFIRNTQSLTCLDFTIPSSPSCTPAVLKSCPTDRFSKFSNTLKWDLIPVNTNETVIKSIDQYCLSTASNAVEVCPCDDGSSQRWTLNDDKILSDEKCLGLVGTEVNIGSCQGQVSWKTYPIVPNAVNLYSKPDFADKSIQLFVDNIYDSKSLPIEFFSSPFSLEIPSGFELIIDKGNNNVETFDSDNAQMSPIDSLTSTIYVKIKPGLIVFEQPAYFGASEYIKVDTDIPSNSLSIGSVIVPEGLRGVVWSNPDFTGDNLGLFESIANFTGVSLSSLDVDATTCENECSSGGDCSGGICVCKPGFAGERCENCSSGFFGPNCQECNCTGLNKNACDDGLLGTGVCKCKQGFTGENCVAECNCGNGQCDEQGTCQCNAGFLLDVNTKQCTKCKEGYYKSELDCKSCPPGCESCDETGKCTQCLPELENSPDNAGTCIPKAKAPPTLNACLTNQFFNVETGQCEGCDPACATCFGQGPGKCLQCQPPDLYLEGSCAKVIVGSGKCFTNNNQSFFADNTRKICEACPNSCLDCSIPNFTEQSPVEDMVCTKCMAGFSLDNGKCVKDCGEGKYSDENFICQACDSSCASCKGPAQNDCIKCINKNFFSLDGVCSSTQCPSGFAAIDTVCTACHPDCLECSGPGIDQCTKCPPNRPILKDGQDGQCIEVCPKGTYADENDKCQKCDADCSSCIGPRADQCLGCNDPNKIIIEGSCSGSCPTGSGVNKIERLCQNLADGEILSPGEANKKNIIRLEWWHILLIVLASLSFLVLVVLLIRRCAVKRRKKKTKEFGENFDDNAVALNLKNALRASRGTIAPPEMSHNLRSVSTQEESATPPTHERRKDDTWQRKQERRQKHMSINSDDYNNWKKNNSKVWENFDAVTEESSSNVEHEAPTERRNSYKYHNRNSKGSLRSNHRISVKRSYTVPDDWTLPKLENQ